MARPYYLAVALVGTLVGCTPRTAPIAPSGLRAVPPATVASWARAVRPDHPTRYQLRWRFTTQQGSAAGRAVVRYQGPDTLRFDYRAPFGRSGAAVFVGPEALWAEPDEGVRELVPTAPLLWAGVGLPLDPPAGAAVTALERGGLRAWRYVTPGETLDVVWRADRRQLQAEYRRGDRVVGLADVQYDAAGHPATAELRFPAEAARLTFSFEAVETVAAFAPDTWRRP